jgi:predicted Zn-dependent protease
VRLSRDDREVLGVLAHEVGHVEARHGLRLVAQGAATTLVIGWLVGDFTSVIAVAPSALLHARYSRDFEREADTHAADVLLSRGISPAFLADILERIEANREPAARPAGPIEYLSTHPATRQRLEYLRERTRGAGPSSTVSPSDSAACCLTDLGRSA